MSAVSVELGGLVDIVMGQAPPSSACNKDGTGTVFVKAGEFQERSPLVREWTTQPLKMAAPDDSLVCVVGATAGKVNYSAFECAIGRSVAAVRPYRANLDASFLYQFLRTKVEQLRDRSQGAAQGVITREMLQSLMLVVPPLPEQRRIAAILDKADALRTQRREALAQLDRLAQAIFVEMFGDPVTNTKGWHVRPLEEVADFFAGNSLPDGQKYTDQEAGYFLMRVSDMNLPGNEKTIKRCLYWSMVGGSRAGTCPMNSIVIPKRGGAIGTNKKRITGRATILDPNLMAIHPKAGIISLAYLFQWFHGFDLTSISSGSSVPQLNKQDLAQLNIQVPDFGSQQDFSVRMERIEALKASASAALDMTDSLFMSLQHRAFRGEL